MPGRRGRHPVVAEFFRAQKPSGNHELEGGFNRNIDGDQLFLRHIQEEPVGGAGRFRHVNGHEFPSRTGGKGRVVFRSDKPDDETSFSGELEEHGPLEELFLVHGRRVNDLLDDQVDFIEDRNAPDDRIAGCDDLASEIIFCRETDQIDDDD